MFSGCAGVFGCGVAAVLGLLRRVAAFLLAAPGTAGAGVSVRGLLPDQILDGYAAVAARAQWSLPASSR
jgi:hypothetical protein